MRMSCQLCVYNKQRMNNSTSNIVSYVPVTSVVLYVVGIINSVTITIGIIGNVLTVSTILKTKYLRTPMNASLVGLACSDIVVCVVVLPLRLVLYSNVYSQNSLLILCKFDTLMKSFCDYVQPSMLVATSFERYKAIAKPFQSKGKMKRIVIVIIATWSTCLSCGVVCAIWLQDGATLNPCNMSYRNGHLEVWNFREGIVTLPLGVCCLALVGIFYFFMLKTLRNHSNKMSKRSKSCKNKVHPAADRRNVNKESVLPTTTPGRHNEYVHHTPPTTTTSVAQQYASNEARDSGKIKTDAATPIKSPSPNTFTNATTKDRKLSSEPAWTSFASDDDTVPGIHAYTRNISVRKSRDVVYVTSNRNMRFPSFVKQVVTIKRQKRRSMERWKMKQRKSHFGANGDVVGCSDEVSGKNRICAETSKSNLHKQIGNERFKAISKAVIKANVPEISNDILGVENTNVTTKEENADIIEARITIESMNAKPCVSMDDFNVDISKYNGSRNYESRQRFALTTHSISKSCPDLSQKALQVTDVCDNNVNCDYIPEDGTVSHQIDLETIDEKQTNKLRSIHDSDKSNTTIEITRENESEVEEITTSINTNQPGAKMTGRKISDVQLGKEVRQEQNNVRSATKERTGVTMKQNETNTENKSHVDIVDFDGTVHKDVAVEGAVVGAVCVMNKTNKLEGKRKVEMRAAKRIAVMIGSFVLLWLPLPLIVVFVSSTQQISSKDIEALMLSASISATTVAVNPMLNLLLNKQLRSATITIVRRSLNSLKRTMLQ